MPHGYRPGCWKALGDHILRPQRSSNALQWFSSVAYRWDHGAKRMLRVRRLTDEMSLRIKLVNHMRSQTEELPVSGAEMRHSDWFEKQLHLQQAIQSKGCMEKSASAFAKSERQ